jgi:IPTL-CTERM motif
MSIDLHDRMHRALCLLVATFAVAGPAIASPVTLDDETVTFCQDGYPINAAVDGDFGSASGWAVYGQIGNNQTAVFKASNDVGGSTATQLTFQLHMFWGDAHTLGRFRLSATTSDRSTYGQGATCNDATPAGSANWTVLVPQSVSSQNGQTLTPQPDGSVLASGANPSGDRVTFRVETSMKGITGFRLEALADSSLADNGPGRASNGNFVLNELTVDARSSVAVPSVGTWAMALMALLLAGMALRRLRTQRS